MNTLVVRVASTTFTVVFTAALLAGCARAESAITPGAGNPKARVAAERFLETYVDDDGRVVRSDQGNDTVSEGQAYGMLLAAAIGDRPQFDRVWRWTKQHLGRPDALLSWRWQDGQVVDEESATDGDLDIARALLVAAGRFDHDRYRDDAVEIGEAVLEHETVEVGGLPVLVAGPWAKTPPQTLNPSYVSPRTYAALADTSDDRRWSELRGTGVGQVRTLTVDGLPPDWARLREGEAVASAPPDGGLAGFGFDAMRVPVRLAEDCDADVRRVAARLWPDLRTRPRSNPVEFVAAAAAADAAGRSRDRDALLDAAEDADRMQPTYYGSAWIALGRVMLTTDLLGRCP